MGRDGTVWFRSGATDERYRTDADSCYAYARGQVDHDARIEKDVGAAFQSEAGGGVTEVIFDRYTPERTDYEAIVDKLIKAKIDVLYAPPFVDQAAPAPRQALEE